MLLEEIKTIRSSPRDLKTFGLVVGTFFAVLGALFLWRGRPGTLYWFLAAAFFLVLGFLRPAFLKPIQKVWMTAALLMGWVMTRVVLGVLFYAVITPIGLVSRACGKDFMTSKIDPAQESYWLTRPPGAEGPEGYENQY
ncbi:MAG: hypothetical protein HYZ52_02395 [Candidatus Omnitrophica bacterium]|nr:hypothetical protein [Candidatus Omnitrophota bacterium]